MAVEDIPGFTFTVFQNDSVPDEVFRQVQGVFAENYLYANQSYLEKNLGKLRFLSVATAADRRLAAFAMGESRVIDLPRLPASNVRLAGLCCVSAPFRRHGLFGRLEGRRSAFRPDPPGRQTKRVHRSCCGRRASRFPRLAGWCRDGGSAA